MQSFPSEVKVFHLQVVTPVREHPLNAHTATQDAPQEKKEPHKFSTEDFVCFERELLRENFLFRKHIM